MFIIITCPRKPKPILLSKMPFRTQRKLTNVVGVPVGISKGIEMYVKECEACIKARAVNHEPITFTELLSCLWPEVGANIFISKSLPYLILM